MPTLPSLIAQTPMVRRLSPSSQARLVEIIRFCMVGGFNWVVDVAVFNVARWLLPAGWVLVAKIIAVGVAATFSWVVNRQWTFRARATTRPTTKEFVGFLVINAIGMLPPLLCLWISHYVLGLTSVLADNISANVIGLILGTILRYFGYRYLVFTNAPRA